MVIITKGILMGILLWLANRSMKKHATKGKLFYGKWLLIPALASNLLILFIFFASNDQPKDYGAAAAIIIMFELLALPCILEYKYTKGIYNDHKIAYHTPWSGLKICKWSEIEKISYSDNWHWYVFHCKDGRKMRFSYFITGIDLFIDFANQKNIQFEI